jgi:hypothetical protein
MKSQAHRNFEDLLRTVVNSPASEVKRRMEEAGAENEWARETKQPIHRARPIVRPVGVVETRKTSSRGVGAAPRKAN